MKRPLIDAINAAERKQEAKEAMKNQTEEDGGSTDLGRKIKGAVQAVLIEETRPSGIPERN